MTLKQKIECLRYLVFTYVGILSLACVGQIVLGIILFWDHVSLNDLVENSFWKPAAALICMGIIMLLVCWLGWNSTRKKKRCNLVMFCTILLLSSCVQIYVAYWAHYLRRSVMKTENEQFEDSLDTTFNVFFSHHRYQPDHIWNRVQEEYQCCGVDGPANYRRSSAVPWSCLVKEKTKEVDDFDSKSDHVFAGGAVKVIQVGCLEVLSDLVRSHLLYGAISSLVSAALQIVGIFFTMQLVLMLGRKMPLPPNFDMASHTLRMKLKADLEKPLAERRRQTESGFSNTPFGFNEGPSHV